MNYSSICLLRGQEYEMKSLQAKFALLRDNKRQLIARTLLLNGFTNWFSYTGSIGMSSATEAGLFTVYYYRSVMNYRGKWVDSSFIVRQC